MKSKIFTPLLLLAIFFQSVNILSAQDDSMLNTAVRHLLQQQEELGLTTADLNHYKLSDQYQSKHNGVSHIYLNQEHQDIVVLNAIINVNVLPDGKILNVGNRFVPSLAEKVNGSTPVLTATHAVQSAMESVNIKGTPPTNFQSAQGEMAYTFDPSGIALEPIKVHLVYQPMKDKTVRLAWMVEIYQLDAKHWWNIRVDAYNGEILKFHDQVIHCDFDHPGNKCSDHVHKNIVKPTAPKAAKKSTASSSAAVLANTYAVFPFPLTSPDHGDLELVSDPSNGDASPFGWHDTDGVAGPEFTITRGNNVHAYNDIRNANASADDEPEGGASLDFNYPLDINSDFPYTQIDPAVTNLFYWNNIIHDIWYQYGFDEASGNFQVNNYGNGGQDGDPVRAEALDGGGTNNANFGTGADGSGARMQMFIWTNQDLPDFPLPALTVTAPDAQLGEYEFAAANFGGALPQPAISSRVVLVEDGTDPASDGCEDLLNGADLEGFVAMIDRGSCQFGNKMLSAEQAGAIAVIICNNEPGGGVIGMAPGDVGDQVTIPGVMVSFEDCATLKMGLPELSIELGSTFIPIPTPGPSGIDGDFDNGIIVHEYGHGISIRLSGGPSTGNCLSSPEQAGEGWSDWFALALTTDASNTPNERRGMGTYATREPTNGTGIREYPYSRDMNINRHTYGDVPSLIAPHGVGSAWCAMIWDMYWNLVDEYGFSDDIYNGTLGNNIAMQLVLDGLKLQSCDPSFIDSRDAILAADEANYGGANRCLIWETFARRGLGFSASAGGNEAFDVPTFCTPIDVIKTAAASSEAGQTLTYTLEIFNNTPGLLNNAVITDQLPEGTTFVEGSVSCGNGSVSGSTLTLDLDDLAANSAITCTYDVLVAATPFSFVALEDDVENGTDTWTVSNGSGTENWETNGNSYEGDLAWFAVNVPTMSDQYLTLAEPIIFTEDKPSLAFWHWYNTETNWDGGVVEYSTDNGNSWEDIGNNRFTQNGYSGIIQINQDSPISGRLAFNGNSGGYIQSIIDLSSFKDQELLIRFRFGSDAAQAAEGWYIDNIEFFGNFHSITNTACINSAGQDESCSQATTIINGAPSATNDISDLVNINVTPNPTEGQFILTINATDNGPINIQLLSVDGKILSQQNFDYSNGTFPLDLSRYESGMYLLKVEKAGGSVVEKVVKI